MEYVPNESLAQIYKREGRMDPARLLSILSQVARGLYVAHERGVIHRDVKPANIMVAPNGQVKITDFGVSYSTNQAPITAAGMVVGTAQYISPEQAQGKTATPQSDIYSLGVVAYEGLAGHRPFTGATPVDIAAAQVNDPVPPLPEDVDRQLAAYVYRMLAKDPAKRPRTALDVSHTFSQIEKRLVDAKTGVFPAVTPGMTPGMTPTAVAFAGTASPGIAGTAGATRPTETTPRRSTGAPFSPSLPAPGGRPAADGVSGIPTAPPAPHSTPASQAASSAPGSGFPGSTHAAISERAAAGIAADAATIPATPVPGARHTPEHAVTEPSAAAHAPYPRHGRPRTVRSAPHPWRRTPPAPASTDDHDGNPDPGNRTHRQPVLEPYRVGGSFLDRLGEGLHHLQSKVGTLFEPPDDINVPDPHDGSDQHGAGPDPHDGPDLHDGRQMNVTTAHTDGTRRQDPPEWRAGTQADRVEDRNEEDPDE
jgi:hypothetical protein